MPWQPEIPELDKEAFLSEAEDHLKNWEKTLLELERDPENADTLQRLFRSIHTLKGCSGFVGCEELAEVCHALESLIQEMREGRRLLGPEMAQALFDGLDLSRRLIEALGSDSEFEGDVDGLLRRLEALRQSDTGAAVPHAASPEAPSPASNAGSEADTQYGAPTRAYAINVQVSADRKEAYLRALLIHSKLEDLGKILEISPSLEDLRLSEGEFSFRVHIQTASDAEELHRQINIDQVEVLSIEELLPGLENKEAEGTRQDDASQAARRSRTEEVVRVPVGKLDVMMNLVGELVVQNSGFVATVKQLKDLHGRTPAVLDLEEKTGFLARIARDLQDSVMKVRLLPVATIFSRFHRVIRDLAKDRGKEIQLQVYGEQTEIDKRVMDRIAEPLIHILRNCVDHGIEPAPERAAYGKQAQGMIRLGAYQEGDCICLEVSDDGRGLDRQRIGESALRLGLVGAQDLEHMSDEQMLELLFLPGFSTASEVTEVSGRGIGLDIVKRTVEELGGSLRMESTIGLGTTTTITLPLTMAIINALLVETCGVTVAIPLSSVREVIQPRADDLENLHENRVIRLRDEVVTVLELDRTLGLRRAEKLETPREDQQISIVVVDHSGLRVGLVVDTLRSREEIVIKSLGRNFAEIEGLVGVSILGTGRVALIADVKSMLAGFYRQSQGAFTRELSPAESQAPGPGPRLQPPTQGRREGPRPSPAPSARKPALSTDPVEVQQEEDLPVGQLDKSRLDGILIAGAVQASDSLSALLSQEVHVSFPELRFLPLPDVASVLGGPERQVGGIYVPIEGDIVGGALLVLPVEQTLRFGDLLLGRQEGTTQQIGEQEASGLKETANILAAAFVGAISDATGTNVRPRTPVMAIDMCQAVIDGVLASFNNPGKRILLIEADLFYAEVHEVLCHLLILLERASLQRLLDALSAPAPEREEGPGIAPGGGGSQ